MAYDPDTDAELGTDVQPAGYTGPQPEQRPEQLFRQTTPDIYKPNYGSNTPALAPQTAPALRRALSHVPSMSELAQGERGDVVQLGSLSPVEEPEAAPASSSFGRDMGRSVLNDMRGWGQDFISAGRWINDQTVNSPWVREKADEWTKGLGKDIETSIKAMSPTMRNAAKASLTGSLGLTNDVDENGQPIPSIFSSPGMFADWAAQRMASFAPIAALGLVPRTVAWGVTEGLLFGTQATGQVYHSLVDAVMRLPDAEYQKSSPAYAELRKTLPEAEAKQKAIGGTWLSVMGAGAVGAAAGPLVGKFFGPARETAEAAQRGFWAGRARGAAEGALGMGGFQGGVAAAQQGANVQSGVQRDLDYQAMALEAATGFMGGAAFGTLFAGRQKPKAAERPPEPPPETPPEGIGPEEHAALTAAMPKNEGGPTTPVDVSGVPGYSPPTGPERIYPTPALMRPQAVPEGEPTGIPGYSPPPAGGGEPPPGGGGGGGGGMPTGGGAPAPMGGGGGTAVPPTTGEPPAATRAAIARSKGAQAAPTTQATPPASRTTVPMKDWPSYGLDTEAMRGELATKYGINVKGGPNSVSAAYDNAVWRERARQPTQEQPARQEPPPVTTVVGGERPTGAPAAVEPAPIREGEAAPPSEPVKVGSSPEPAGAAALTPEVQLEPHQQDGLRAVDAAQGAIKVPKGAPVEALVNQAFEHARQVMRESPSEAAALVQLRTRLSEAKGRVREAYGRVIKEYTGASLRAKAPAETVPVEATKTLTLEGKPTTVKVLAEAPRPEVTEAEQVRAKPKESMRAEDIEARAAAAPEQTTMDLTPVAAKDAITSDIRKKFRERLRAMDRGDETPAEASRKFDKQGTEGGPRTPGYDTLAEQLRARIKRARDENLQKKLFAEIDAINRDETISRSEKSNRLRKPVNALKELGEARARELQDYLDRLEDPVGHAVREQGDRPYHLSGTPSVAGINPQSSRFVRVHSDRRLNDFIHSGLRASVEDGTPYTLHDALRAIVQHSGVRTEMRPLWQLARMLLSRTQDVEIHTPDSLRQRGEVSEENYRFLSNPGVAGGYTGPHRGEPAHIVLNPRSEDTSHVQTVVHEAVHRALDAHISNLLRVEPRHPDLQALRAIADEFSRLRTDLSLADPIRETINLMRGDPHEVATYLLTNPELAAFAVSRQASPELLSTMRRLGLDTEPKQSVWRTFVNATRRALGLGAPTSASDYTLFDHAMRPLAHIMEHAVAYNERLLPHDPVLRDAAKPLFRTVSTSLSPRARDQVERVLDHVDPKGVGSRVARALFTSAPTDRLIERFLPLAQDGETNHLRNVRTANERAEVSRRGFVREFHDDTGDIVRALKGKDDVAALMNDAGYAKASLGTSDPEANAHLTTPEQRARLAELQQRFDALPVEDRKLYQDTRDLLARKNTREREAILNSTINRYLPDATTAERTALRDALKSLSSVNKFLADPNNAAIAEHHRVIARGIAALHRIGFVQGDYFPMRRFGDFVVEYGGKFGDPDYGVQMFESHRAAEAFRRDAHARGLDPQQVRERDQIVQQRLPTSPVIDEMLAAVRKNPDLKDHAQELQDLATKLQLQYASGAERNRSKRRYVAGASKDVARAIQSDMHTTAMRIGRIEHGGELAEAMQALGYHADHLAQSGGDAFTLDQVHHELQRRFEVGDQVSYTGPSGWARRATSFGFVQSLMSMSRIATETAEMHLKMGAFIGARHGHARAALELGRALKDISPTLLARGAKNTWNTLLGRRLRDADYNLSQLARDRLEKIYGKSQTDSFFKHFDNIGLFDQTQAMALKELARPTNMGKMANWFIDVSSAMSHASDEMNRIAGAWAAYRAELSKGGSTKAALQFAEDTLRKAPNYSPANRPRIATDKGVFGKFSAPIMQFKLYGLNEGWLLANLVHDISSNPAARKEAIVALGGMFMAHSMMAGLLTWYADPARYIGGVYDFLTGNKPTDRSLIARKFMADMFGPELGELLSRGAPHALGIDVHRRLGVENMLNIPQMEGFGPKDWAEFMGHIAMGAPGEDAASMVNGVGKVLNGDFLGGLKDMLPRIVRDPVKAYELATTGVRDQYGKVMLPPEKLTTANIISQAVGFAPSPVTEVRERRQAIRQAESHIADDRSQLVRRWLEADPADRAAIMPEIHAFNADKNNLGARITYTQLLTQLHQRTKGARTAEQTGGLKLPKRMARGLIEQGAFANVP